MYTLSASDAIGGVADAASQVTYTIFGMTLIGTTEAYDVLAQGQLPNSAAAIYTAPNPGQAFIRSMTFVNGDTIAHTLQLFVNGTTAAKAITPVMTLPASGFATYEDGTGWKVYSSTGTLQAGLYSEVDMDAFLTRD